MQVHPSHGSYITNYYYTNYTKCPKNTSYFATWQFLALFTHSVLVIQVPMVILTGYCILKKTPKVMGSLKWAMFNMHIWNSYLDIYFCSLTTPYIFFPAMAGFPVGLLKVLGVPTSLQAFIGITPIGVMFSAIAALFENRSSSFKINRFRFEKNSTRFAFFVTNGVVFTGFIVPVFLNIPDQEEAMIGWMNFLVCPAEDFFTMPVFVLVGSVFWGFYIASVLAIEFICMMSISLFFIACTTYYMFFTDQNRYSASTKKLQKMFFFGNLLQIAIPGAFWALPFLGIATFFTLRYNNQSITNIGICFISLHGLVSMIVVLLIHRPYRIYVQSFFKTTEVIISPQPSVLL